MGIDCKSRALEHVSREMFTFALATRNTGEKMDESLQIITPIVTHLYLRNGRTEKKLYFTDRLSRNVGNELPLHNA